MKSAVFLDGNGQPKREIAYTCPTLPKNQNQKLSFWKVKVADIEKDGVCEFWAADTGKEYTLLDNQGKLLFCNCDKNNQLKPDALKKRLLATTSITTGDLDGDGKQELIGFGGDRLRAFNGKGEMVIDQDVTPNATVNLRAFDTNGDGKDEILYARGGVSFLDSKGQNEKRLTRPEWASGSLLESGETPKTLVFAKNRLNLLDYNGNLSASYEAPYLIEGKKWQEIVIADALKVRFYSNQPKCLAVLADLTEVDKSLLYIYAPDGKLMYQELLSMDRIRNLEFHAAALPKDDGAESLLLVSGDTVLQYTIK